jgi:hypothetical protein
MANTQPKPDRNNQLWNKPRGIRGKTGRQTKGQKDREKRKTLIANYPCLFFTSFSLFPVAGSCVPVLPDSGLHYPLSIADSQLFRRFFVLR